MYTKRKKINANAEPPKLEVRKMGALYQLLAEEFQIRMAKAMAGFTGLALMTVSLIPANSIAPKYEPAKIMV